MEKKTNLRCLTECAILIAIATVLSFIKLYKLPLGGSITALSMLPIILAGYRNGFKWSVIASFTYAFLQLMVDIAEIASWGLTAGIFAGAVVFDYLLAYGSLCLAGLFSGKKYGLLWGTLASLPVRFIMHFISGYVFFGSWATEGYTPFLYSIVYNGSYMLPELIITAIAAVIISNIPAISGQEKMMR